MKRKWAWQQIKNGNFGKWLVWLLEGIIIGGGAILPGISGGVLSVTFGIYQPMMATLAHPKENIKRYWKMFVPILIGWALGFVIFSKGVSVIFQADSHLAISLFSGLVAGSLPQLFLDAEKEGSRRRDWVGFSLVLILSLIAVMGVTSAVDTMHLQPNFFWYIFCGVLWGLSFVVPGMTSSTVLIWLGLYQPLMDAISSFQLGALVPFGIGILATVLLTARVVNACFERYYGLASRVIVAIVIASTVAIVPTSFASVADGLLCAAAFAVGFAGAWAMDRYGKIPGK